jgi:hypothetical protein
VIAAAKLSRVHARFGGRVALAMALHATSDCEKLSIDPDSPTSTFKTLASSEADLESGGEYSSKNRKYGPIWFVCLVDPIGRANLAMAVDEELH